MNKISLTVPYGTQFISEWKDYTLPTNQHCIVDKGVTGCGYTEYCLCNSNNVVLCSPRKLLLENKMDQHSQDSNIIYLENNITDFQDTKVIQDKIINHYQYCKVNLLPCKLLVTYDSCHYVVNALQNWGVLGDFIFVVDEFQSIFGDAFFKSEVELGFVETLQSCPSVIYLSATPMLDKYLDRLTEFKNLPFYQLDWSESGYVEAVIIQRKNVKCLSKEAKDIIKDYLDGKFPITLNKKTKKPIESKEAVFYLNSVTEIVRIVHSMGLTPSNTRIICSDQEKNRKALKRIKFDIGKVPLPGETNPMFMFCTSTTYMGVDLYSDCASTYVFSDPNITSLATDIHQGLPQIVGRQRNKDNPFKNNITVFFKIQKKPVTRADFDQLQEERRKATKILLDTFMNMTPDAQKEYIKKIRSDITLSQYSDDFVSISRNTHLPVYNPLIEVADERAWEVSQVDYQSKINVTRALIDAGFTTKEYQSNKDRIIKNFLDQFYGTGFFHERMRLYCEFRDSCSNDQEILDSLRHQILDPRFENYYEFFGTSGCKANGYQDGNLVSKFRNVTKDELLKEKILLAFSVGKSYAKPHIKNTLNKLYKDLNINAKAKSTDLRRYFNISPTNVMFEGKVLHGFKIVDKL